MGTAAVAKIRLEVGTDAESVLDGQSRICNWLYNELLEMASVLRARYRLDQDAATGKVLYTSGACGICCPSSNGCTRF